MAKDPAFLFYTNDFSTGTQFLSDEQVGKYVRLLMAQHQHGHLSEKRMMQICKSHDEDVFSKFIKDDNGLYFNERLEIEIVKRRNYSQSRSNNRTHNKNISFSYQSDMENRNRDKDTNTIKTNKNGESKKFSGNFKAQGEELFAERHRKRSEKNIRGGEKDTISKE